MHFLLPRIHLHTLVFDSIPNSLTSLFKNITITEISFFLPVA